MILKLSASQNFKMNTDSRTLKPVDSDSVKILTKKTFKMSYFCRLK